MPSLLSALTSWLSPPKAEHPHADTLAKLEKRLHRVQAELRESMDYADSLLDPLERWRDGERLYAPMGYLRDRQRGDNWPVLATVEDLRRYRGQARLLVDTNSYASGFLDRLVDFVVGDGHTVSFKLRGVKTGATSTGGVVDADGDGRPDVDPAIEACEQITDEFKELNQWGCGEEDREVECYRRFERDGEVGVRFFAGGTNTNGIPRVRQVEPEQIDNPPNMAPNESWGIRTDAEDVETVEAFYVRSMTDLTGAGKWIDASEIVFSKANTDRTVKRGISSFAIVATAFEQCDKINRNMAEVSAIQAAIAYVRQHAAGTMPDQITALIQGGEDYQAKRRPGRAGDRYTSVQFTDPGQVVDMSAGMEFQAGPASAAVTQFVAALQSRLRQVCARFGMPEFFTGDASNNNYASILVSGGPFERAVKRKQRRYAAFQEAVYKRALEYAVEAGRLSAADLVAVMVCVTPPGVSIANKKEEAEIRDMEIANKTLSVQTAIIAAGRDPALELANIEAWQAKFGNDLGQLPGDEMGGGGDGGGGGPSSPAAESFDPSQPRDGHGRFASQGVAPLTPGGNLKKQLLAMKRSATDPKTKDAFDIAAGNMTAKHGHPDHEKQAGRRLVQVANDMRRLGHTDAADAAEHALSGIATKLHEAGSTHPFDPVRHDADGPVRAGDPVTVTQPGWAMRDDKGEYILSKTKVKAGHSLESFDPSKHPRADDGKFGTKGGGKDGDNGSKAVEAPVAPEPKTEPGKPKGWEGTPAELVRHRADLIGAATAGIKGKGFSAQFARINVYTLLNHDGVAELVPPGSTFLGAGTEAVAFKTPAGEVFRLTLDGGDRPDIPEVLQPLETHLVGERGDGKLPVRVERLPMAKKVPKAQQPDAIRALHAALAARGYEWTDDKSANVGLIDGMVKIIDPGNIERKELPGDERVAGRDGRSDRRAAESFDPSKHPRAEDGKFGTKGGATSAAAVSADHAAHFDAIYNNTDSPPWIEFRSQPDTTESDSAADVKAAHEEEADAHRKNFTKFYGAVADRMAAVGASDERVSKLKEIGEKYKDKLAAGADVVAERAAAMWEADRRSGDAYEKYELAGEGDDRAALRQAAKDARREYSRASRSYESAVGRYEATHSDGLSAVYHYAVKVADKLDPRPGP